MSAESALVVLIPEAEVAVGSLRQRFDPSAALGLPAHVTILYPFKPPAELTLDVIDQLAELFARVPPFDVSFSEPKVFPRVLYLASDPDAPFRRLTAIISEQFPEHRSYRGEFKDVIPHLTVAHADDSQQLAMIASEFADHAESLLPIRASVTEVALLDNESGRWQVRKKFNLKTCAGDS